MFDQFKEAYLDYYNTHLRLQQFFKVDVDTDLLWDTYLDCFPIEEKQHHNCSACKYFIRNYSNLVTIDKDCVVRSIWDVQPLVEIHPIFSKVLQRLAVEIYKHPIKDVFVTDTTKLGVDHNYQLLEDKTSIRWEHLFITIPKESIQLVKHYEEINPKQAAYRDLQSVFKRGLDEISLETVNTVLDLIYDNNLYRGEEFKSTLESWKKLKTEYEVVHEDNKVNFTWSKILHTPATVLRLRNSSIGTLLVDIEKSENMDAAVSKFEALMAPTNYKRPKALITPQMIKSAKERLTELGILDSLQRTLVTSKDVPVKDLIYLNRDKPSDNIFDILDNDVQHNPSKLKTKKIGLSDFLTKVLPKSSKVEVLFERKHISNLVSLVGPSVEDSPNIFKWDNPYSWTYHNGLSDSIKEKVKQAGGETDGYLRVSLGWSNYDDLDLHILEPGRIKIYYRNKTSCKTGGKLDVDMNAGGGYTRTPVENIIYPSQKKMTEGAYLVSVHQFCKRETKDTGFTVEIEVGNQFYSFSQKDSPKDLAYVDVAKIYYCSKSGEITIKPLIDSESNICTSNEWGIDTYKFHKVNEICYSPNYWDNEIGNKHIFFFLEGCTNQDVSIRPFFNEYLKNEYMNDKRVFEVLANRLDVQRVNKELSGLGFSLTQDNNLIVRVDSKLYTINIK
jgi:hypothetical protein